MYICMYICKYVYTHTGKYRVRVSVNMYAHTGKYICIHILRGRGQKMTKERDQCK